MATASINVHIYPPGRIFYEATEYHPKNFSSYQGMFYCPISAIAQTPTLTDLQAYLQQRSTQSASLTAFKNVGATRSCKGM